MGSHVGKVARSLPSKDRDAHSATLGLKVGDEERAFCY